VGAHVSLPWRNTERAHVSNVLPLVVKDWCLDVRIGRSFLELQAVQHLVDGKSVSPSSTQHVAHIAEALYLYNLEFPLPKNDLY
jgi:hypothetical protein